eukprot:s134_g7.t1
MFLVLQQEEELQGRQQEDLDTSKANPTAAAIRNDLGLKQPSRSSMATPPPGRASGSPAQWLRSASCDRPQPERQSAVLEKLPAARSRPSLDAYSSAKPAPAAPPTPQGEGDVSQLQDALAHALCNVEGEAVASRHECGEHFARPRWRPG